MPNEAQVEPWALEGQEAPTEPADKTSASAAEQEAPLSEVEKLAQELGWKPKSQWKGDDQGWTPAEDYIRTTAQKHQASSERARELDKRVRDRERAVDDYRSRLERLERATNQMMSLQEQRHRAELEAYYEAAKKEAAKAGDDAKYDQLLNDQRKAERELDERFQPDAADDPRAIADRMIADPVVGKFLRNNAWIVEDEEAYAYATAVAQQYADLGHPPAAQVKAAEEMLRLYYPERYAASRRAPPARAAQNDDEFVDVESPPSQREAAVRDPETGRFVPARDGHLYEQQPARRAPPAVASGNRMPNASVRQSPEQAAWNALPQEAREVYRRQKESGAFKGDVMAFKAIYFGEKRDVL